MLLQLFFDIALLSIIIHIVAPWERNEWRKHVLLGFGIAVMNFLLMLALVKPLGYGALAVILIADGLVIAKFCYLPMKHTVITVGSFVGAKVVLALAFNAAFATAEPTNKRALEPVHPVAPAPVVSQMI